MNDQQPEAAHAASEIDEPRHNPYTGPSIVLGFILTLMTLAIVLVVWASLEG